ncbi:MAG: hypothetical protein FD123_2634 [Bacteroidetes bacterium]|nr:MAG: hypothetical protein FD123_2634 [Bacteroidota bacterium]
MKSISSIVRSLRPKIEKLLHLQEQLQKDNARLRNEKAGLEKEVSALKEAHKQLEDKYKALKIARAVHGGPKESNLEIKLKINELVREIDKCIAQLNR